MDIRQIEFFVAVAELRSFTRAAELSNVTQSGLSASVRVLERELGAQLFERSPRGVALTAAGQAFLPRARRMLDDARAAQRDLRDAPAAGTLTLGSEQCQGDLVDLSDLLATLQARHPGVSVRFEQLPSQALLDRLGRRELDVALLALPSGRTVPGHGTWTRSFELARTGFELVAAPSHPLAHRSVSWSELEEHAFVDLSSGWTARQIVDDAFADRRLARRTAFTVNDVHMLLELVHRGLGVAIVPTPLAAKPQAEGLARCPMPLADLSWVVHCVIVTDSAAPVRLFADMLLAVDTIDTVRRSVASSDNEEA